MDIHWKFHKTCPKTVKDIWNTNVIFFLNKVYKYTCTSTINDSTKVACCHSHMQRWPWLSRSNQYTQTLLHLHLQLFYGPLTVSGTTRVSQYQKRKTRKVKPIWIHWSKRKWVAVASARPYDNIPPLSFLQTRCPSCRPTNSITALKANTTLWNILYIYITYKANGNNF